MKISGSMVVIIMRKSIKPIDILKVRLAKGEITKAELEELRQVVDWVVD